MISATPPPELYVKEQPNLLPAAVTNPRNADIESRIQRSDEAYLAGQLAYQRGDMADARRCFDRAIDLLLSAPESASDRIRVERRLEQLVDVIYRYDVNGLGASQELDRVVYDKSPLDEIREMTFPIDPRLKTKVKDEIAATSSQLPLEFNESVLSAINFFSSERGKKILIAGTRRSGRYRPMIQRILGEEGVPQELIYLAQIESGFYPRAISYKSCVGMWQFAAFRGREYGLNQNREVDERMDPEKATRAAARHLHDLYNQLGDWYLAMAAYNCGPNCVDRAVQRTGYADFWKLRDVGALPKETTNYVPVILAITIMMKNAKDYGLEGMDMEPALDYDTVTLTAPTNLALIADATERPVAEIRDLNAAVLRGVAPSGFEIRIPKGTGSLLTAALESVPAERRAAWRMHKVVAGESLTDIAKRYSTPVAAIAATNTVVDAPSAGDVLLIPASYQEPREATAKRVASRAGAVSRAKKTAGHTASVAPARKTAPVRKATYGHHVPPRVAQRKATVKTASLN